MADPYRSRYTSIATADTDGITRPSYSNPLTSEEPPLPSHQLSSYDALHVPSSTFLHRDARMYRREYAFDDVSPSAAGLRYDEPGHDGPSVVRPYPPPEDANLVTQSFDNKPVATQTVVVADVENGRAGSLPNADSPLGLTEHSSNVLFVDGLPTNCTRREVGHLFRPFVGFKDIKVIHKEPRRSRAKAMVLCFVEFSDAKRALTAMEALHGYKFDDKKPDSSTLKITFAHFPFRHPSERDDPRIMPRNRIAAVGFEFDK
ncbi:hypothetical protein ACFE04_017631 [Oxalis oulophora]